jgi:hypothetical protein
MMPIGSPTLASHPPPHAHTQVPPPHSEQTSHAVHTHIGSGKGATSTGGLQPNHNTSNSHGVVSVSPIMPHSGPSQHVYGVLTTNNIAMGVTSVSFVHGGSVTSRPTYTFNHPNVPSLFNANAEQEQSAIAAGPAALSPQNVASLTGLSDVARNPGPLSAATEDTAGSKPAGFNYAAAVKFGGQSSPGEHTSPQLSPHQMQTHQMQTHQMQTHLPHPSNMDISPTSHAPTLPQQLQTHVGDISSLMGGMQISNSQLQTEPARQQTLHDSNNVMFAYSVNMQPLRMATSNPIPPEDVNTTQPRFAQTNQYHQHQQPAAFMQRNVGQQMQQQQGGYVHMHHSYRPHPQQPQSLRQNEDDPTHHRFTGYQHEHINSTDVSLGRNILQSSTGGVDGDHHQRIQEPTNQQQQMQHQV